MWRVRMASEYHSASVFQRIAVQLMEAGAALDSQAVVTRMAFDELRHADLCADALEALGTAPECFVPDFLPELTSHPEVSRQQAALRNVVYSCAMTEMVNTARFVDTLERTTDPYFHELLRQLLADEVKHGAFGFQYLATWSDWLARHDRERALLEGFLRRAFFAFERTMSERDAPRVPLTEDERALGMPDPTRLADVFYQTVEHAIVPGLERAGLAAAEAYRRRSPE